MRFASACELLGDMLGIHPAFTVRQLVHHVRFLDLRPKHSYHEHDWVGEILGLLPAYPAPTLLAGPQQVALRGRNA